MKLFLRQQIVSEAPLDNKNDYLNKNSIEKFEKYSKEEGLWKAGDGIVVGVSGGADSLCLLYFFCAIREKYNLKIYGIHIHHGVRGSEANEDAEYAKEIAKKWGLPFETRYVKVLDYVKETGLTEEEAGRKLRYQEFEEYRKEVGAEKIAVAHHENDKSETILFNLEVISLIKEEGMHKKITSTDFKSSNSFTALMFSCNLVFG